MQSHRCTLFLLVVTVSISPLSKAPSHDHTVKGNRVRWFNKRGIENPCWDGENRGRVSGWDDNQWHADLDDKLLPTDLLGTP